MATLEISRTETVEFDEVTASWSQHIGGVLEHFSLYNEGEFVYEGTSRAEYERAKEQLSDD